MSKNIHIVLDSVKGNTGSRKVAYIYKPNKKFDLRISKEEREKTKTMFQVAQEELGETVFDVNVCTRPLLDFAANFINELDFDINTSTADMMQAVEDSGIRFGRNRFLETVF